MANQPPRWDVADRMLTVYLPKGESFPVRYSSYVLREELEDHGIWDWLNDEDDQESSSRLRRCAEAGAHWMITPARTLMLVHAIQHPLQPARFTELEVSRTYGQTRAEFENGVIELHAPSTGRIEVIGRWKEFLDDKAEGLRTEDRESVAVDYAVVEGWKSRMTFPPAPLNLRRCHEFGDTRHRRVKYLVRATSAYREYLPDSIKAKDLTTPTLTADEFEVSIPNSARPIPPDILYTVPTFNWLTTPPAPGWAAHTQRCGGGGLRIYLDQTWNQSGEGELLGIVLKGQKAPPNSPCSRYGLDATWFGTPQPPQPEPLEPRHFPNRVRFDTMKSAGLTQVGVRLDEAAVDAVVVGFQPEWDRQRKLWFCDIDLDVDALPWNYWPFLRLALVRFQPQSLDDAMVSKIVLAEFTQVAPDRTLSLTWQDDKRHVLVALRGRAPAITRQNPQGTDCALDEPRDGPYAPRVALRVQTTSVPTGSDPDELDWEYTTGHPAEIGVEQFSGLVEPTDPYCDGNLLWEKVQELPVDRDAARMRLEVAEYQLIRSDEDVGSGLTRITYAAHVELA